MFIYSFFAVSCEDNDNSDNGDYGPIESEILFTLASDNMVGTGTTGFISLYLKTEMIYGCFNYEIVYDIIKQTDRIEIDLIDIDLPGEICEDLLGPARVRIPLGITQGEFNLYFAHNSLKDNHYVSISDSSIAVTMIDSNFTHYLEYSSGEWW